MRHDMSLPEWQALTLRNSKRWFPFAGDDREQVIHQALGLCGEVGEVVEHVKKFHRGDFGAEELAERLHSELPDVLTYLLNLSECLGVDIAEALMEKQAICEQRWGSPENVEEPTND
jgi:NTP pyrophosphatase (non-canonical NTP hydrolase)